MRLNHNLHSLNIYREHTKNIKNQSISSSRISSGYKANSANENPNGIAQSERLRMQIRGLQMAQRNAQDGISMLQTADSGLDSITNMLHRIKELTVQAGGTGSDSDKAVIQGEISQMLEAIETTVNNTEFNGVNLIKNEKVGDNSAPISLEMPSGANIDEKIKIPTYNLSLEKLGSIDSPMRLKDIDVSSVNGVDKALNILDGALETVLSVRSKYGALQNRFERSFEITSSIGDTIQKAESSVRDADIAEEMMKYAKNNILIEAGNALMVQSNRFPQDILRILENVRSK